MKKKMVINERLYDNPIDKDGNKKPNKYLGTFIIRQTLFEDFYAGKWVGERVGSKGDTKYLITQTEVSGMYNPERGGSRFTVELVRLDQ